MNTPFCTWSVSLVTRVMSVGPPSSSMSAWASDMMCAKRSSRRRVPKPAESFAAKYCAVMAHTRPTTVSTTMRMTDLVMRPVSPARTPSSMTCATMSGTASPNAASRSLNKGASTHSLT